MSERQIPRHMRPNRLSSRPLKTTRIASVICVAASVLLMGCNAQKGSAERAGAGDLTHEEQFKAMYPLGCNLVSARDKGVDPAAPNKRDLVSLRVRVPRNTNVPRSDVNVVSQNHLAVRPTEGEFSGFSYWRDYNLGRDKKILDNATIHEGEVSGDAPTQGAELAVDRQALNDKLEVDIFGVANTTGERKKITAEYYCGHLAISGTPELGITEIRLAPDANKTLVPRISEKPL